MARDPKVRLPVLHCTEVSQQTVEKGQERRIGHVRGMSAEPSTMEVGVATRNPYSVPSGL